MKKIGTYYLTSSKTKQLMMETKREGRMKEGKGGEGKRIKMRGKRKERGKKKTNSDWSSEKSVKRERRVKKIKNKLGEYHRVQWERRVCKKKKYIYTYIPKLNKC